MIMSNKDGVEKNKTLHSGRGRGALLATYSIFSEQGADHVLNALLEQQQQQQSSSSSSAGLVSTYASRYASSSSSSSTSSESDDNSGDDTGDESSSSGNGGSEQQVVVVEEQEGEEQADTARIGAQQKEQEEIGETLPAAAGHDGQTAEEGASAVVTTVPAAAAPSTLKQQPKPKQNKHQKKQERAHREKQRELQKHLDNVPFVQFPLAKKQNNNNDATVLEIPSCLLDESSEKLQHTTSTLQKLLNKNKQPQNQSIVVVFFLRSGRFAGGVFAGSECVVHTTSTRYTTRRGQGKAQSAQDGSSKAQSMGAQLRRYGETQLQKDVEETCQNWQSYLEQSSYIFVAVAKTMKKNLYRCIPQKLHTRIRRVPLDLRRPSFETVCIIHSVLTTVTIRKEQQQPTTTESAATASAISDDSNSKLPALREEGSKDKEDDEEDLSIPLTPLHVASQNGDEDAIAELLGDSEEVDDKNNSNMVINQRAGPIWMTPLHYASEAGQSAMVRQLLVQYSADPTIVDARNRTPYFLAQNEETRNAFRQARHELGKEFCDWKQSHVGPPLSTSDVEQKKQREAEKRRRKRAKQKEKKAQEKAQQREAEELRIQAEQQQREQEEAKRVRAGLKEKIAGACDFCQKVCKGRQRNQMFHRLEYKYCSSECVQKHKRELMAAAATARFGGSS